MLHSPCSLASTHLTARPTVPPCKRAFHRPSVCANSQSDRNKDMIASFEDRRRETNDPAQAVQDDGVSTTLPDSATTTTTSSSTEAAARSSRGKGAKKESKGKKRSQEKEKEKEARKQIGGSGLKGGVSSRALEAELRLMQVTSTTLPVLSKATGIDMEIDTRIPPFHEEVMTAGWPAGCDEKYCLALIRLGYETARMMDVHNLQLFKEQSPEEVMDSDTGNLMVRFPASALKSEDALRGFLSWLTSARMGSVRIHDAAGYEAAGVIYASFTNTPVHGDEVTFVAGSTECVHVAVGFVDLSTAAAAAAAAAAIRSSGEAGMQLRWVGYEISVHAVAKSASIAQMLADGAEVDEILQVWYSSTWSARTYVAFQTAVAKASQQATPPVKDLLNHWQGCGEVNLTEARQLWLSSRKRSAALIGNFVRKADRIAFARYFVSGELLQGASGNLTMFAVPSEYGAKDADENFLQTIPFEEVFARVSESNNCLDIIAAGVEVLRTRIACLADGVKNKRINLEVNYGAVDPASPALLAHIASQRPTSMSWSNVCDYYRPAEFHAMARACSHDGTHTAHMMNYVKCVKGACHMDFLVSTPLASLLLEAAYDESLINIDEEYEQAGYKQLLLSAPVDNACNLVDIVLFAKYYKEWLKAFFTEHGGLWWRSSPTPFLPARPRQAKVLEAPGKYNPIKRTCATMRVAFIYADKLPEAVQ